jgi:hypothetical protein
MLSSMKITKKDFDFSIIEIVYEALEDKYQV